MTRSKDEFNRDFRGRFLLFLTEAWAARKEQPSDLGMLMDRHSVELRRLLNDVYDYLTPPAPPAPNGETNGKASTPGGLRGVPARIDAPVSGNGGPHKPR